MKIRRPAFLFYLFIIILGVPLFVTYVFVNAPDLSEEQILQHKVVDLRERLRHAEMLNQERRQDILTLKKQLSLTAKAALAYRNENDNYRKGNSNLSLEWETEQLLNALNHEELDLQLPAIYHYLPHLVKSEESLIPSYRLAKKKKAGVSVVLGIPTVKRDVQSYLMSTLQNLIENMSPEERDESVIVVFIAETDKDYILKLAVEIQMQFNDYINSGLLEIIAPPTMYYPEFGSLRQTLGDPLDRVKWRTKQNLDFAYLMMYCQPKGTFYVQLEDDVLTKPGYITTMKNFAYKQLNERKDWLILDFCQLGFIGKMFKCVDLSQLIVFFIMFHNDKPVDWLLDHLVQTKVCRIDKDMKECKKQKDKVWIHFRPSLYQHVGTHSSLKGKVQKLKDKLYGKLALHIPHKNPTAKVVSSLKVYKTYTAQRAYQGETFFWSLLPQNGDNVTIYFTPPVAIESFVFRSGNVEHPDDKFFNTTVEILPFNPIPEHHLPETADGYLVVGKFNQNGIAEGTLPPHIGIIKVMRLHMHSESDRWAILSEILIKSRLEGKKKS